MRGLASALLLLFAACSRTPPAAEANELLVVTGLRGTTEPCGCTSHPLGGLDRLAGRVDALRPAALAFVGDTYFTPDAPPEQEEAKARAIGQVIDHLKPDFIVTGAHDAKNGKHEVTPSRTLRIDGRRVAVSTQEALDCTKLGPVKDSDVHVLLLGEPQQTCEPDVDVVITLGGEKPLGPRQIGRAVWLDGGDRGQHIGRLAFHGEGDGPWSFDDGGHSALAARAAMVKRLEDEIDALDDGPAKDARRARLESWRHASVETKHPEGRYMTWSLDVIDRDTAKAEWAAPVLGAYNQSLCEITKVSTRKRTCAAAADPRDVYVGNEPCRACHAEAFAVYNQTQHARAWSTLEQASKSCDLSCIGCHSVGYEKPGGYCRLDDVEKYENVGCENCHGPGAGHVAHPDDRKLWSPEFRRGRAADNCMQCHTHEHSDHFDFDTYLPRILGRGHGGAVGK